MRTHSVQDSLTAKKVAFSAKILTSGFWPKQRIRNVIYPPEMQSIKVVTFCAHFHLLLSFFHTYIYIYVYVCMYVCMYGFIHKYGEIYTHTVHTCHA